jgi:D-alanine-D-alanine ligase-like ATP-grasp enzyme
LKGKPVDSQFLFLAIIIIPIFFFHFKLHFCSLAQGFDSLSDFAEHLATNVDIVFPVIHGKFGEDGGIQVCSYQ